MEERDLLRAEWINVIQYAAFIFFSLESVYVRRNKELTHTTALPTLKKFTYWTSIFSQEAPVQSTLNDFQHKMRHKLIVFCLSGLHINLEVCCYPPILEWVRLSKAELACIAALPSATWKRLPVVSYPQEDPEMTTRLPPQLALVGAPK